MNIDSCELTLPLSLPKANLLLWPVPGQQDGGEDGEKDDEEQGNVHTVHQAWRIYTSSPEEYTDIFKFFI